MGPGRRANEQIRRRTDPIVTSCALHTNIMARVVPYSKIAHSHDHPEGVCDEMTVSDFC